MGVGGMVRVFILILMLKSKHTVGVTGVTYMIFFMYKQE